MLELALLEALTVNKEKSAEVLWALDGPVMTVLLHSSQIGDGPSIRKALRSLQGFQSTLRTLIDSIDGGMNIVEEQSQELLMSTGICGLPEDILYLLFDYARLEQHHSHRQKAHSLPVEITLSHVCRQFRCKILQSPTLWNNIYSWYPRDMTNAYYSRSKGAGLTVRLTLTDLDYPYSRLYGMSNGHVGRWKELYLNTDAEFWSDKEIGVLQKLASWLSSFTFSQLRALSVKLPAYSYDSYTEGKFISPFYGDWRMPALRELELCNILPGKVNLHPTLTSLQLTIENLSMLTQYNKDRIWSFLQSSPSLSHFTLSIIVSNFSEFSNSSLVPIVLPRLRSLRLEDRFGRSMAPFRNALTHIHAPALSNLHLEATFSDRCPPDDYVKWVAHVCPLLEKFQSVTDLALFINVTSGRRKGEVFHVGGLSRIFSSLPRLGRFHFGCRAPFEMQALDTKVVNGSSTFMGSHNPSLTRLCWHNCSISDQYLSTFLQNLAACPSWSAFEALEYVEDSKVFCVPKSIIDGLLARGIPVSWTTVVKCHPFS